MRSSAYEHKIPERLFSTEDNPAEGVSTAKALSLAMAQGQKIYTLTTENKGQLANITIDDNARSEISQALSIGLEVTVHERPINVNGWEGSGYSIIDTDYGVGAYKISGGENGGFARGLGYVSGMLAMVAMSGGLGVIGLPVLIALVYSLAILLIATVISVVIDENYSAGQAVLDVACGFLIALSIASAVNHFAKILVGTLNSIINTVGALMTIGGYALGVCT